MEKKEFKKLQKELDLFLKTRNYGFKFVYPVYFLVFFSFSIFFIPCDLLNKYPYLESFVNFLNKIIPSIDIYSHHSIFPEVIKIYLSFIWVFLFLTFIWLIFIIRKVNKEAKDFFGTNEFHNNCFGVLPDKFLYVIPSFVKNPYSKKPLYFYIFMSILMFSIIFLNYTGNLIEYEYLETIFSNIFQTKFNILFIINMLHIFPLYFIFILNAIYIINTINIKKRISWSKKI